MGAGELAPSPYLGSTIELALVAGTGPSADTVQWTGMGEMFLTLPLPDHLW